MKKTKYFTTFCGVIHFLIPLAILHGFSLASFATDYYVLPYDRTQLNGNGLSSSRPTVNGGSGGWNGLKNIDWSLVTGGDLLLLKRDEVYFDQLNVMRSGETNKPIIFKSFGTGEKPVISGSKKLSHASSDWRYEEQQQRWVCSKFADGIPSSTIYNAAIVDGSPLERAYSSDFSKFYGQFSNNKFKKTVFADNMPWKHEIYVSILPYNLLIDKKSYLVFFDIDFTLANGWSNPQFGNINVINASHHISFINCKITYGSFSGVWVVGSDHISLDSCEIFGNYCTGLYFRAGASYATITNCKIYQNGKYLSVNNHTDTGALLMGSSGTGTGHLIQNNEIYDNGRPTVTERVNGVLPSGNIPWVKHAGKIWKKNLAELKRWGGTSKSQGVHFLGINGVPQKQAESINRCNNENSWYWERLEQTLYHFSTDDPNTTKDVLEIAWYNGADPAISLWGITNSIIKDNKISKNFCSGIGATYTTCANLTITDNIITDNLLNHSRLCRGLKYGMGISGQGGHVIKGNIIRNNGGDEMIGNPQNAGLLIATSSISPVNNTEISNNFIAFNGGYQLSWYKYLTGDVLRNTHSDYSTFSGNHLFYYLNMEYNDINSYNIASSQDMHSLLERMSISTPQNLRSVK